MGRGIPIGIALLLVLAACSAAEPTLEDALGDAESVEGAEQPTEADESDAPDTVPVDVSDVEDATDHEPGGSQAPDPAEDSGDEANGHVTDAGSEPTDDPFAVPDPIDGEYAELVINELLLVLSDSLRDYLADEDPGGAYAEQVIREIYGEPVIEARLDTLRTVFGTDEGRATQFAPEDFGVQRFELIELVEAGQDCVTVYGFYDLSETSRFPYDDTAAAIVIKRDEDFRSEINQTSWRMWDGSLLMRDGEPYPVDELDQADNLHEIVDMACVGDSG